jgi:hypothetical protein
MSLRDSKEVFSDLSKLLDNAKDIDWKILAAAALHKDVCVAIFLFIKERTGILSRLVYSAQIELQSSLAGH